MAETRVTISDVAEKAGVSAQTVSRVINNKGEISAETRERVLNVIRELGYRPNRIARSLATQQTFTIGLVIPDITNPFFSELTRGAEDVAWETGYNVLLSNTEEKEEREKASLRLLEETRVDGVILCSSRMCEAELFPMLEGFRSVVLVNRVAPDTIAGVVRTDDYEGGMIAANHMLSVGRNRIAFLGGPPKSFSGGERLRGGKDALRAVGLDVCPDWMLYCPPNRRAGYELTRTLLTKYPEIHAFICYNDLIAVGVLQACADMHLRVPEDIAVIGFDDISLSRVVCPPLTTIGVSKIDLGAAAARLLLDRLQGRLSEHEVIFKPNLILRGSTPSLK